jgi:hypothetical protein
MTWVTLASVALISGAIVAGICFLLAPYLRTVWPLYCVLGGALACVCAGLTLALAWSLNHGQDPAFLAHFIVWCPHYPALMCAWTLGRDRVARPDTDESKRRLDPRRRGLWDRQLDG